MPMPTPTLQTERIEATKDRVRTEAAYGRWNQSTFVNPRLVFEDGVVDDGVYQGYRPGHRAVGVDLCKTTLCFAGHATIESGGNLELVAGSVQFVVDGETVDPEEYASEWLGLNTTERNALFFTFTSDVEEYLSTVDRVLAGAYR